MKFLNKKKRVACLVISILLIGMLNGCAQANGTPVSNSTPSSSTGSSQLNSIPATVTSEDSNADWDAAKAVSITLSGDSASAESAAVQIDGGTITIQNAGTYVFSGTLNDGQIVIDADKNDTVQIVLNGVNLTSSSSAPIYAKQAGKTILTLADSTENTVTDAQTYVFAQGEDEPDAAVFSKDDLTINGSGSLMVNARFNNGIGSKDDLIITGGEIVVTAANHGIRGRDSVTVTGGTFTIDAQQDGIQSNNDTDIEKGWIAISGGTFSITAAHDAIQAETALSISGGEFDLVSGDGSTAAQLKTENPFPGSPAAQKQTPQATATATAAETTSDSYKGLKSGTSISVNGGNFHINAADDAVHSNGDVTIEDGILTISTGDDGIHADGACTVNGGTIHILQSYEGLEGTTVEINSGEIRLTASDDGINSAGGSDDTGTGWMGPDSFHSGDDSYIRITGGFVSVDASGDGLDSNGNLYIDGGVILVNGPTNSGNGALDYDGVCEVTGGTLLAAGSAGMAQGISVSSAQAGLMISYAQPQEANTLMSLTDSDGNVVAAFAPSKQYQSIVISTPGLLQSESYTLSAGGVCSGEDKEGYYAEGEVTGAEKKTDVTLADIMTSIADDGSSFAGGMGMRGGMPGRNHERPAGTEGERPELPEGMQPGQGGGRTNRQPLDPSAEVGPASSASTQK